MAPARRRTWLLSAGGSLAWHLFVVAPVVARLLTAPPPPLELTYLELDDEKPGEEPSAKADDKKPEDEKPDEKKPEKKPDEKKPKPEDPPEDPAQRKPEKKPEEPKPTPPLELTMMPHLKMVDQDQFPDEQDNSDARFLAQKNHRASEDVQAAERNLVQRMDGTAVQSSPSENKDQRVGEKEQKSAELQDRPGDPRHLPSSAPPQTPVPLPPNQAVAKLAMISPQQATPRAASPTPLTPERDGLEAPSETGPEKQPSRGDKEAPQGAPGTPGWSPQRLTYKDYDRIIGFDVSETERRSAARAERSQSSGRWDRLAAQQEMLRSALENFMPMVRVGSQSELGTRAHPFAAYLASVHRQIHRFWGDGFLADLDRKTNRDVYDYSLVTALELAIHEDGTLAKVFILKPSGRLEFDTAAILAVNSAAPFPTPPDKIKSKDGNVYVTWLFHRDERQCATDFVHPHILDTPPRLPGPGGASPGTPATAPAPGVPSKPVLVARNDGPRPLQLNPALGLMPQGRGAPPSAPGGRGSGPRPEPGPPTASSGEPSPEPAAKSAPAPTVVPEEAKVAAERWLAGYEGSNLRVLTGSSALPFLAGGKIVAQDSPSLKAYYEDMLGEGTPRRDRVHYMTPAQIKKRLGRLPRGGDSDEAMFALVELHGGEDLILLLEPADKGWRVIGLDR